jgi:hypothetical protein
MPHLTPETVRQLVAAKGTRFATVTFTKSNGETRQINGHFRAGKHIKGTGRPVADHLVAIYSMKDEGWRSFRADSVLEIK